MPLKAKTELLMEPRTLPAVVSTIAFGSVATTADPGDWAFSPAPAGMPAWSEAIPTRAPPPRSRSRRRMGRATSRLFDPAGPRSTWSLIAHLHPRIGMVAVLYPPDAFYH